MIPLNVHVSFWTGSEWLDVNDREAGYRAAKGSFETVSVTHRKNTITNPFVEGSIVSHSLRENIVEPLNIHITGETTAEVDRKLMVLRTIFDQPQFDCAITIEDTTRSIRCYASDYSIYRPQEFLHARMARLDVQLERDPSDNFELTDEGNPIPLPLPDPGLEDYELAIGTVSTSPPGGAAEAYISGSAPSQTLSLVLPRGSEGPAGPAVTMQVGTVTTGAPGSSAALELEQEDNVVTVNITIPQGSTGPQGARGSISLHTWANYR